MERHLRILDHTGDTTLTYDDTPDVMNNVMSVAEAERAFCGTRAKGFMAYRLDGDHGGTVIKDFDPNAREIIMHRPMQGG